MLNILRKRAQSVVIQAMVFLIAVVFIFWGVGSNLNNSGNAVAIVNDEEISYQDYRQSFDRAVDTYQEQYGGQLPDGLIEAVGLKNQVLNQLIQAELLRQGAQQVGLMISKEEIRRRVQEMEAFLTNGQFDMARYKEVLRRNRLTPTSFEAGLKDDLTTAGITRLIGSFADVPDNAVQAWLDYGSEEIKIGYAMFSGKDYLDDVLIDDDKLAVWFEGNKEKYKTKSQMQLKYLFFPFADDLEQVEVQQEEVATRYREDIEKYTVGEKRRARHILFKVGEAEGDERKTAQREAAEDVLKMIQDGGDFAELAATYSEGPTKDNGGDLGFFSRGQMVPQFENAVFAMQEGEIAGPVATPFGYHLILLEEIQPSAIRDLKEVEGDILAQLKQQRVRGITFKKASAAYEGIIRAGSLDKYVAGGGAEPVETEFFAREIPPDALADADALLDVATGLAQGELSSLVETASGYGIAYVVAVKQPQVPDLQEVKDKVTADYTSEQSIELARAAAEAFLKEASTEGRLPEGKGVQQSEYLKRNDFSGSLPGELVQKAFALKAGNKLGEEVISAGNDFYVFELMGKRQSATPVSQVQQEELAGSLLRDQQNRLVANWVDQLRSEAKIWVNDKILE